MLKKKILLLQEKRYEENDAGNLGKGVDFTREYFRNLTNLDKNIVTSGRNRE